MTSGVFRYNDRGLSWQPAAAGRPVMISKQEALAQEVNAHAYSGFHACRRCRGGKAWKARIATEFGGAA